jgi:hypothetical protein
MPYNRSKKKEFAKSTASPIRSAANRPPSSTGWRNGTHRSVHGVDVGVELLPERRGRHGGAGGGGGVGSRRSWDWGG